MLGRSYGNKKNRFHKNWCGTRGCWTNQRRFWLGAVRSMKKSSRPSISMSSLRRPWFDKFNNSRARRECHRRETNNRTSYRRNIAKLQQSIKENCINSNRHISRNHMPLTKVGSESVSPYKSWKNWETCCWASFCVGMKRRSETVDEAKTFQNWSGSWLATQMRPL